MEKFQVVVDADLAPIMSRYFEIQHGELVRLEKAIKSEDDKTIRLIGHKFKGTGTSYGFEQLTKLGAAIESAGENGNITEAAELTAKVRDFLENVDVVYRDQA